MNTIKCFFYHLICKFLPETRFHTLKSQMLRWCGAKVGRNCEICSSAKFFGGFNLSIGDNCYIGIDTLIFGSRQSKVIIEDYVTISSKCIVTTGDHEYSITSPSIMVKPGIYGDIKICRGSGISTGCIILPGKTIGTMSHVAAGAVVTKDVPPYVRVAGVPAKIVKNFKEA